MKYMPVCECENTRLMLLQAERYEDVAVFEVKYRQCKGAGCRCNCQPEAIDSHNIYNNDICMLKNQISTMNDIIEQQRKKIEEQAIIIQILNKFI